MKVYEMGRTDNAKLHRRIDETCTCISSYLDVVAASCKRRYRVTISMAEMKHLVQAVYVNVHATVALLVLVA